MKELDLGTGNIKSLVKRFSIPCIISMVFALGLALLVGDGAAAGFSIALGCGNKKQVNKNIGNGLTIIWCCNSSCRCWNCNESIWYCCINRNRDQLAMLSKSIVTMLWAAVISDIISAIVGFLFVRSELDNLTTIR